tara:strand:- start:4124 stop:4282 length:159 start_codon:yes stop_codon:yes gene_type:complete
VLLDAPPTDVVEHPRDAQTDTLLGVRVLEKVSMLLSGVHRWNCRHSFLFDLN